MKRCRDDDSNRHADAPSPAPGLPPVHDPQARVLVLGSFPGVASLKAQAYYAHPRNLFWPIVSRIIDVDLVGLPYPARLDALRHGRIALWDVIQACRRDGSLDAAIRDAIAQDFGPLLSRLPHLRAVAFNGRRAARAQAWFVARGYRTFVLPSTSPAHASLPLPAKVAAWQALRDPLAD